MHAVCWVKNGVYDFGITYISNCLNEYTSHIKVLIASFGNHLIKRTLSTGATLAHCTQSDSLYCQNAWLHITLPVQCHLLIRYGPNNRAQPEIRQGHAQIGWAQAQVQVDPIYSSINLGLSGA